MKRKKTIVRSGLSIVVLMLLAGCTTNKSAALPPVTLPDGSSPAKANAPHTAQNDSDTFRSGWNYGNDVMWVYLLPDGTITPQERQKDGWLRAKFAWWKGYPGHFTLTGRRLDAPAQPMRCSINQESHPDDEFGLMPNYLYFPSEGLWEITGHLNDKTLTFVARVTGPG